MSFFTISGFFPSLLLYLSTDKNKMFYKKREMMKNLAAFFEIPALDFERAVRFYEKAFGSELLTIECANRKNGLLSRRRGEISWCHFLDRRLYPFRKRRTCQFTGGRYGIHSGSYPSTWRKNYSTENKNRSRRKRFLLHFSGC